MSNPGVITLASLRGRSSAGIQRLDIEDNIGESIHIHIDNFRCDLTIDEFLKMADVLSSALTNLFLDRQLDISGIDPIFLSQMYPLLGDLVDIKLEKRRLGDLLVIQRATLSRWTYWLQPCRIASSFIFNYYQTGDRKLLRSYVQYTSDYRDNIKRADSVYQLLADGGYPSRGQHIILFGDEPFIRDGAHRACALVSLYGPNVEVEVKVFRFRGSKWRFPRYSEIAYLPVARSLQYLRKRFLKPFVMRLLRHIKSIP